MWPNRVVGSFQLASQTRRTRRCLSPSCHPRKTSRQIRSLPCLPVWAMALPNEAAAAVMCAGPRRGGSRNLPATNMLRETLKEDNSLVIYVALFFSVNPRNWGTKEFVVHFRYFFFRETPQNIKEITVFAVAKKEKTWSSLLVEQEKCILYIMIWFIYYYFFHGFPQWTSYRTFFPHHCWVLCLTHRHKWCYGFFPCVSMGGWTDEWRVGRCVRSYVNSGSVGLFSSHRLWTPFKGLRTWALCFTYYFPQKNFFSGSCTHTYTRLF